MYIAADIVSISLGIPVYHFSPFSRHREMSETSHHLLEFLLLLRNTDWLIKVRSFLQDQLCKSQITKGLKELFKVGGLSNFKTFGFDNERNVCSQKVKKCLRGR